MIEFRLDIDPNQNVSKILPISPQPYLTFRTHLHVMLVKMSIRLVVKQHSFIPCVQMKNSSSRQFRGVVKQLFIKAGLTIWCVRKNKWLMSLICFVFVKGSIDVLRVYIWEKLFVGYCPYPGQSPFVLRYVSSDNSNALQWIWNFTF